LITHKIERLVYQISGIELLKQASEQTTQNEENQKYQGRLAKLKISLEKGHYKDFQPQGIPLQNDPFEAEKQALEEARVFLESYISNVDHVDNRDFSTIKKKLESVRNKKGARDKESPLRIVALQFMVFGFPCKRNTRKHSLNLINQLKSCP